MTPTKAKFKKTSQKDGLMLTALVGASAVSRALTAAAAMAAAFGIGVWELLTKSGIPGGVTAYNQSTDTRCSCCQKMANHLATTRLDAQTITTQWCVCVCRNNTKVYACVQRTVFVQFILYASHPPHFVHNTGHPISPTHTDWVRSSFTSDIKEQLAIITQYIMQGSSPCHSTILKMGISFSTVNQHILP